MLDDLMLLQLVEAVEAVAKAMAPKAPSAPVSRKERVLRALADVEDLLDSLVEACEDPSLRKIVAEHFKHLEASMAALAVAAHVIQPEPEPIPTESAAEVGQ